MPIPKDNLNREWLEAEENSSIIELLKPSLVTFVAFDKSRVPGVAGSGFIVGNSTVNSRAMLTPFSL